MPSSSSTISLQSWLVLIAIGLLIFLMNIDYTAVNLTLVPISEEINTDLNSLQWLLSGYVLVWAAFVIPAGRIADLYGKRNTLIAGLLLFMMGSSLTGFGQSLEVLITGRILQGCGAAVFTSPAWASIFTLAPPERQGFVMGIIVSFAGLGLAIGPTLAGLIIEEMSWRWIFYINIPLGIFVIAILYLYSPQDVLEKTRQKIDFIGALLLASGLCVTVYALNQIEVWGATSRQFWGLIGLGCALVGVYIFRDRTQKVRMVPPHLFRNKAYMAATIGEFLIAMTFSMTLVLMGLYLQNTLHYSSYETGLIFISMTITMGLLGPIGGKMVDVFGLKAPMVFGTLITTLAMGMMTFLKTDSSLLYVVTALFFAGMGMGAYFTACNTAMMKAAPQGDLNVASGVYTMFMMLGNTLSIILSTSFVVLFGRIHLLQNTQRMNLSAEQHQDLVNIISKVEHSSSQLGGFAQEQVPQLLNWVDEAFVYGLSFNMAMGTLLALSATGLTLWGMGDLKNPSPQAHAPVGA
ncbi:MAG: MFS transporter [Proteobacteria bacterium]|nr:MFS transporter [Pseudomonadota bacterium]